MSWEGEKSGRIVRWQGHRSGRVVRWQCGEGGRAVRWQGGRLLVLFKGVRCRLSPEMDLPMYDGSQNGTENQIKRS